MHAARALATCTPDSVWEAATTGEQPPGYTALHLACDGSDVNLEKLVVVKILLERKVNLEARDAKANTYVRTYAFAYCGRNWLDGSLPKSSRLWCR